MKDGIILIVEDDPILRMATQKQISMVCPVKTQTVGSGEEAAAADLNKVLLIFMDMGLPGMDGKSAALTIRKRIESEQLPPIPIIALTAHADREGCLGAGMDDYLQKPVLINDVKRILERYLQDRLPD